MAYMIMVILSRPGDLDDVLDAWREVGVRNVTFVEIDALLLILCYFAGLWLLYSRGIGG